jgi:hypothetical protein
MPQPESAGRCVKTCVFESESLRQSSQHGTKTPYFLSFIVFRVDGFQIEPQDGPQIGPHFAIG